jgi:flavin reductase (DIM6/NTAB) family NADH-FMN oxidoreductase RutF
MDLKRAIYATYPLVPTIVVVKSKGRLNALSVAWHSWLSFDPPLYMVAIGHERFSYGLLKESGEFTANFLPIGKADIYTLVGRTSGRELDKFREYALETKTFRDFETPYLKDAVAAYACKVVNELPTGDHSIFVSKVLDFYLDPECFGGDGFPDLKNYSPSLYLGKNKYIALKEFVLLHLSLEEALKKMRGIDKFSQPG